MLLLKTVLGLVVVAGVFGLFVLTGYGVGRLAKSVFPDIFIEEGVEAVTALGFLSISIITLILLVLVLSFSVGSVIVTI